MCKNWCKNELIMKHLPFTSIVGFRIKHHTWQRILAASCLLMAWNATCKCVQECSSTLKPQTAGLHPEEPVVSFSHFLWWFHLEKTMSYWGQQNIWNKEQTPDSYGYMDGRASCKGDISCRSQSIACCASNVAFPSGPHDCSEQWRKQGYFMHIVT